MDISENQKTLLGNGIRYIHSIVEKLFIFN